jgi:hypothetical protein
MSYLGPQPIDLEDDELEREIDCPTKFLAIIGLDPGGTTGWSLIVLPINAFESKSLTTILENKIYWVHGQVDCITDFDRGVYTLRRELIDKWSSAAIVCESFYLRNLKGRVDLSPVQIIAILQHNQWMRHRTMHMQQASMAKRLDNDRLKLMNVYTSYGGMNHARDADRHVLMTIRRVMEGKGMKEKLWPTTS